MNQLLSRCSGSNYAVYDDIKDKLHVLITKPDSRTMDYVRRAEQNLGVKIVDLPVNQKCLRNMFRTVKSKKKVMEDHVKVVRKENAIHLKELMSNREKMYSEKQLKMEQILDQYYERNEKAKILRIKAREVKPHQAHFEEKMKAL